jgi:hypothetical protein
MMRIKPRQRHTHPASARPTPNNTPPHFAVDAAGPNRLRAARSRPGATAVARAAGRGAGPRPQPPAPRENTPASGNLACTSSNSCA